ncbi:substrate-binding periplasmic protein [Pseudomonas akapageensis]|uniref:substrate-binding periplasmic protein n=1 Tax=Pseudomonas akapageensis TaxID=2609961 RepID=UPI00140D56E3|nr:transporter substrate-binding domain-containing protein [Pseudomonas akapageensis]
MQRSVFKISALVLLLGTAGLAQASSSCLAEVKASGVLRSGNGLMGTKPFIWQNEDGSYGGFEAELFKEVGKRIGVPKTEYVVTEWSTLIPGMKSKRWDIILSAMSATQERVKNAGILFSDPYFLSYNYVIVKSDSSIKSMADLKGKKLATVMGTDDSLNAHRLADTGVVGEVMDFNGFGEPFQALQNNQADAVLLDQGTLIGQQETMKNLRVVGEPILYQPKPEWAAAEASAPYIYGTQAIAVRDECGDLRQAINGALESMIADGTHQAILEKYGVWDSMQTRLLKH